MFLYYLHSSAFLNNKYAEEIRMRFLLYVEEQPCDSVLISGDDYDLEIFEDFLEVMNHIGIKVYLSPMKITFDKIEATLDDVTLQIANYSDLVAISGMFISIEISEVINITKIYFDMFTEDSILELKKQGELEELEAIDRLIEAKIKNKKHKQKFN